MTEKSRSLVLLTDEAAKELGVSRRTVYRLIATEGLPAVRLGPRMIRIPRDRFRKWAVRRTMRLV